MKRKNKTTILLLIILILLIAIAIGLVYLDSIKKPIKAIDFTSMNEEEITAWAKDNNIEEMFEYTYEYDDDIPQEKVIYQSIKVDEEIDDKVLIVFSKGPNIKLIEVPDFSVMSNLNISVWSQENDVEIIYEYENSKYEEDTFLTQSIEKGQMIEPKTKIIITLSNGKNNETEYINETKYLGYKETDFINELKNLGFNNVKKIDEIYSPKYEEGTICYYLPDGTVNLNTTIEYKVSKGKEDIVYINEKKYLGYKEADFLKEINDLGFKNVVKIGEEYSNKYEVGTICYYLPDGDQNINTKIEYKISKGAEIKEETKSAYIDPYAYLGKTEDVFISELKSLGFKNIVKIEEIYSDKYEEGTICYYLPDGNQSLDATIEYKVSKGKEQNEIAENTKTTIVSFSFIQSNYSSNSFENTKSNIEQYLLTDCGFTNVIIKGVSAEMSVGEIVSLSINNNKNYTAGEYEKNSPIVVEICDHDSSMD